MQINQRDRLSSPLAGGDRFPQTFYKVTTMKPTITTTGGDGSAQRTPTQLAREYLRLASEIQRIEGELAKTRQRLGDTQLELADSVKDARKQRFLNHQGRTYLFTWNPAKGRYCIEAIGSFDDLLDEIEGGDDDE